MPAPSTQAMTPAELKAETLANKAARRRYLKTAPIAEKLRILEEMRDVTLALKSVRDANKAKIRATVKSRLG